MAAVTAALAATKLASQASSKGAMSQNNSTYLPQIAVVNPVYNIGENPVLDNVQRTPITIPSLPTSGIPTSNIDYQFPGGSIEALGDITEQYIPYVLIGLVVIFFLRK